MKSILKVLTFTGIMIFGINVNALECNTEVHGIDLKLELEQDSAIISYNGEVKIVEVQVLYDGHMTSLVIGEDITMVFETHYGCFNNVTLMTTLLQNIGKVTFNKCKGGRTPDDTCFGN